MAIIDWKLEAASQTSVSIFVQTDVASEIVDWVIDGQIYNITCGGPDNIGHQETTGSLEAGRAYSFTLGSSITGTVRTLMPDDAASTVAWIHCQSPEINNEFAKIIEKRDPNFIVYGGDTPYTDASVFVPEERTQWGITAVMSSKEDDGGSAPYPQGVCTREQLNKHFQTCHFNPGNRRLNRQFPNFWVQDDHEFPDGSNEIGWDHSSDEIWGPITDTQIYQIYQNCNNAWRDYHPTMPWAQEAPGDIPAASSDPDGNNYPPNWYSVRCGLAEFFFLDCIGGKSKNQDLDSTSKLLLGNKQMAWLKSALLASQADSTCLYRVIMSSKPLFETAVINGVPILNELDSWLGRQAHMNDFLNWRETAVSGPSGPEPIEGMIWFTGDGHNPAWIDQKAGETYPAGVVPYSETPTEPPIPFNGGTYSHDIAAVQAGPCSSAGFNQGLTQFARKTPTADMIDSNIYHRCIGIGNFYPDRAEIRIINSRDEVLFLGTLLPGSNNWDRTRTYAPQGYSPDITTPPP